MVEDQLDLLLLREVVEGAEAREGVVGGGEDCQAVVAVVQLAVELNVDAGLLEEADEGGVLPALHQDGRQVEGAAGGGRGSLGLGQRGSQEEEGWDRQEEEHEAGRCHGECMEG